MQMLRLDRIRKQMDRFKNSRRKDSRHKSNITFPNGKLSNYVPLQRLKSLQQKYKQLLNKAVNSINNQSQNNLK